MSKLLNFFRNNINHIVRILLFSITITIIVILLPIKSRFQYEYQKTSLHLHFLLNVLASTRIGEVDIIYNGWASQISIAINLYIVIHLWMKELREQGLFLISKGVLQN